METSIYDVAQLAGVSISTVSRVMNSSGYVSSETREKVTEAMETLGFVPSITAQNLAKHQTMLIGLYFSNHISSPQMGMTTYLMEFLRGASEVVMENGYHLLLINESDSDEQISSGECIPKYTAFLKQRRIDGLIIGTAPLNSSSITELIDSDTPMVYIGERLHANRGLNVYAQFEHHVWTSLDHLYERNHRDIVVFSGADFHVKSFVTNYKAYKGDPDLSLVVRKIPVDLNSYLKILSGTFTQHKKPTGLLISDLAKVQPTINYLNNIGLRVPEDVSIITEEHHYQEGEQCHPAVTSVYVPIYEMAVSSVRLLLNYLNGAQNYNRQILLSPRLIERESVAIRL